MGWYFVFWPQPSVHRGWVLKETVPGFFLVVPASLKVSRCQAREETALKQSWPPVIYSALSDEEKAFRHLGLWYIAAVTQLKCWSFSEVGRIDVGVINVRVVVESSSLWPLRSVGQPSSCPAVYRCEIGLGLLLQPDLCYCFTVTLSSQQLKLGLCILINLLSCCWCGSHAVASENYSVRGRVIYCFCKHCDCFRVRGCLHYNLICSCILGKKLKL